jgi:hypothetical protein
VGKCDASWPGKQDCQHTQVIVALLMKKSATDRSCSLQMPHEQAFEFNKSMRLPRLAQLLAFHLDHPYHTLTFLMYSRRSALATVRCLLSTFRYLTWYMRCHI